MPKLIRMKTILSGIGCFLLYSQFVLAQTSPINRKQFFAEESILKASLVIPLNKLFNHSATGKKTFLARFICTLPDSSIANERITVDLRGHFRRENCTIPPMKLNFDQPAATVLAPLKSLKLVSICKTYSESGQYLIKEYLIYKMYNLFTDLSFRVRLLDLSYVDSSLKKKTLNDLAFFIEDEKEMAKRNNAKINEVGKPHTELTDRNQMTLVAIFEYMIGNTDWAVPVRHNIKTVQPKSDEAKLIAIPYDFDYSGLVNADYAVPDPLLNTQTVLERVYRGFPRTMDEINTVLAQFHKQKEAIYALINNCVYLTKNYKRIMIDYLNEFYDDIRHQKTVQNIFIDNARSL